MTTQLELFEKAGGGVATLAPEDIDKLLALSGQTATGGDSTGLPRLRINYSPEYVFDDDDIDPETGETREPITLKRGHFKVTFRDEDSGELVTSYAPKCKVRILRKVTQYSVYDNEENTTALLTEPFNDWKEVIRDDQGNEFAANVYKARILDKYPEYNGVLKCNNVVYCLVSMEGKDMYGKSLPIEDMPVVWYSKGVNFMPINDIMKNMFKKRLPTQYYPLELKNKREKAGTGPDAVTYFITEFSVLPGDSGPEGINLGEMTQSAVDQINADKEAVYEKYDKMLAKFNADNMAKDFNAPLDIPATIMPAEISRGGLADDEIPF